MKRRRTSRQSRGDAAPENKSTFGFAMLYSVPLTAFVGSVLIEKSKFGIQSQHREIGKITHQREKAKIEKKSQHPMTGLILFHGKKREFGKARSPPE